jgi:MinD superfamily P-loop ATPase
MRAHFDAPFGLHPLKTTLKKNGIFTLPTTYVINKKGEVVFKKVEELDWSDAAFIKEIRQLVQ